MKSLNITAMLIILISMAACSSFKTVTPSIEQEDLPAICDGLIPIIKKNWKQHKKTKYYQYNEDFLTVLQRDYQDCLMTFKKEDIIKLLGQPTENIDEDAVSYALNEGCMEVLQQDCSVLFFQFRKNNGSLMIFLVQENNSHIHNIEN